jgi:hypothetical protein
VKEKEHRQSLAPEGRHDPYTRIYRPSFHENKPKTLVFSHAKRAFWACFRKHWVYNFGALVIFALAGIPHPLILNNQDEHNCKPLGHLNPSPWL